MMEKKDKKLKILQVIPTFDKGGCEKLVIDLANFLTDQGHLVNILCIYKSDREGQVNQNQLNPQIKIHYVSGTIINKKDNPFINYFKKVMLYLTIIFWAVKENNFIYNYDIINVHLTSPAFLGTIIQFLKPRKSATKVLETNHADSSTIIGLLSVFYRFNWKFRDGIIFELKKEDFNLFQKEHPSISTVYIPIGTSKPEFLTSKEYAPPFSAEKNGAIHIGQIGRFNIVDRRTDKYVILFNEIYKLTGNKIHFFMYGDGPDRKIIEKMIEQYGMQDQIHVMGYTNDIAKALSNLDIYVTINVSENCGVAGLQAMWSNVATVGIQVDASYDESKLDDRIPNSRDMKVLAKYIVGLIDEEAIRNILAKNQHAYVTINHSIKAYCEGKENFYYSVIENKNTGK